MNTIARQILLGVESQNFTQYTFHIRIGSQYQIGFRKTLFLNYTYSRESFIIPLTKKDSAKTAPQIDADLHTATLGFRWRF